MFPANMPGSFGVKPSGEQLVPFSNVMAENIASQCFLMPTLQLQ
jgi:hypothetical protein